MNFYLFALPAWQLIDSWLLTLAVAGCAVALLFLAITSGARSLASKRLTYAPSPWRGLSLTVSFLLLVLAMSVYVGRFQLMLDHHTIFDGINYTDAHITIQGLPGGLRGAGGGGGDCGVECGAAVAGRDDYRGGGSGGGLPMWWWDWWGGM